MFILTFWRRFSFIVFIPYCNIWLYYDNELCRLSLLARLCLYFIVIYAIDLFKPRQRVHLCLLSLK